MCNIKRIRGMISFKHLVKSNFLFLERLGYKETRDRKLLIEGWQNGVAYTNGYKVIVFLLDKREGLFSTIIYKIQTDFLIPDVESEEYKVLDFYLKKNKGIEYTGIYTDYRNYGKEKVVKNTAKLVDKMSEELL